MRPAPETFRAIALAIATLVLALAHAAAVAGDTGAPATTVANPFALHRFAPADRFSLEGDVRAVIDAGSYLYVDVEDDTGERHWIAALAATSPAQPTRVRVWVVGRTDDFVSRRLSRRFDTLLFGVVRDAASDSSPTDEAPHDAQ